MPKPQMSLTKKVNLQFAAVQSSYWMTFFPISGFAVVLLQSKNFTGSEIGVILSLQYAASIFAQPLISSFSSRNPHIALKNIVITMLLIGAGISSILFFLPHLFLPAILIFMIIGMTEMSTPAFLNAIAMQITNSGVKLNYGVARGLGSLSFALLGVGLGKLVDLAGTNTIIPVFILTVLIACFFLSRLYAPAPKESPEDGDAILTVMPQTSIWTFLRSNKAYTGFCVASGLIFASHACINTFLPNIMDALGGTAADQGITRSIAAAFEIPIMFAYSFVARRISSNKLLIISAFSFFLKALATMLVPGVAFMFMIQIFQLSGFGLYTTAAVHYSDKAVSDVDRVRSQAISMVAGIGIGNVIGNLGGGIMIDRWGIHGLLLAACALSFTGFVVMFLFLGEKKRDRLSQ